MSTEIPHPVPLLERWRMLSDTLEFIREASPRSKRLFSHLNSLQNLNVAASSETSEAIGLSISDTEAFNSSITELSFAVKREMNEIKPQVVAEVVLDAAEQKVIEKVIAQKPPIIAMLGENEESLEAVREFYTRVIQLARINYGHIETVTEVLEEAVHEKFSPKLSGLISQRMFQINHNLKENDTSFATVIHQSVVLFKKELRQALPEEWFDIPEKPDVSQETEIRTIESSLWRFFADEELRKELLNVWRCISPTERGFIKDDPSGFEASLILSRFLGFRPEELREKATDFTLAVREALIADSD